MHQTRRNRLKGSLLAAAVGLPFLLAVVAHAVGRPPQPVPPGEPRAALAFDQYLVDLGATSPSEQVAARFRFTNTGNCPVTLKDLQPSCGCLTPEIRKKVYQPHESGDLVLRVQTANQEVGPKEYHLTVNYEDGRKRQAELVFRVNLPDNQVTIRPRALIFYQLGRNATSQELVITDRRAQSLDVLGVRCGSDLAEVELLDSIRDEHGARQHRVKVTIAGNVPPGRTNDVVTVFTSDAAYPQLRVPLIIEGAFPRAADAREARNQRETARERESSLRQ